MPCDMQIPFSGGCACGAIRYECTDKPLGMHNCHCRDCQRASGGPFSPVIVVPAVAFRILQGPLSFYAVAGHFGADTHRGFCAQCGSPILGKSDAAPQFLGIKVSSLDDPSWFKAQADIFTSEAQPWDLMDPVLPKFEQYPPFVASG